MCFLTNHTEKKNDIEKLPCLCYNKKRVLQRKRKGNDSMAYSRVYIEITNICNMSCSFCHGHSRTKGMMSYEAFQAVLTALEGKTQYLYYHLMGEPLLHPELPRFLKAAKEKGFHSMITTNGTLLDRCGDVILEAGVHKVNISVHSLENCSETVFLNYMNRIVSFAEKADRLGVIVVFRLWNSGCDEGLNDRVIRFLKNRLAGEWSENTRGVKIRNKLFLEWGDRFVWPDKEATMYGNDVYCYGMRDHFGILCDGTVVPCCLDSDGVIALGNLFETPLDEILSSPRAQAIKKGFECRTASEELCRRCGYAQRWSLGD